MSTVLVASGGGHLQQLLALAPRLGLGPDLVWAAPASGLTDVVLRDQRHIEIPYAPSRDWRASIRLVSMAKRILSEVEATRIVSTGASPAPPFFLAGARLGLDMHYIESATRTVGPSLSGRLVATLPSVALYTQYPSWAGGRWHFEGSIFDPYSAEPIEPTDASLRRVVVTLGTEAFGFRRAVDRLLEVIPAEAEVMWQTGHTNVDGLGIDGRGRVPADELRAAIAEADVVVCHAGTGSALAAFDLGKAPLLLPRSSSHGEHVDDHQYLTVAELTRRGLAVSADVDELTADHLERARRIGIVTDSSVRPFRLLLPDDDSRRRWGRRMKLPWR